jgi:hypothetical protein
MVDSKNQWFAESFMYISIRSVIIRDIDVPSVDTGTDFKKIRGVFFKCKIWSLEFSKRALDKLKRIDLERFMKRLVDQCDIHNVIWPFDSMIPKKPFVLGSLYSGNLKELRDQYSARITDVRQPYEPTCRYIENYIKGGEEHKLEDTIENYIDSNKLKSGIAKNELGYLVSNEIPVTAPSLPYNSVVVTQAIS